MQAGERAPVGSAWPIGFRPSRADTRVRGDKVVAPAVLIGLATRRWARHHPEFYTSSCIRGRHCPRARLPKLQAAVTVLCVGSCFVQHTSPAAGFHCHSPTRLASCAELPAGGIAFSSGVLLDPISRLVDVGRWGVVVDLTLRFACSEFTIGCVKILAQKWLLRRGHPPTPLPYRATRH
jgi:hypothetical protein